MNSEIHKTLMKSFENDTLLTYTSSSFSVGEAQKASAMEDAFAYDGVKHGHSYISQQCTLNLVKNLFASSSEVAKSLSCARTKSRAIAYNILAPYFTRKIIDEIYVNKE